MRPSLLVWSLVFVACVVAGSTIVLVTWPKHAPAATPVFWVAVVIVPVTLAAITVLLPFRAHAGKLRAIRSWNSRCDHQIARAHEWESRPVALLGGVCRFSSEKGSQVAKVAAGDIKLAPQQTPDRAATVAARWFRAPEFVVGTDPREYDLERQRVILPGVLFVMLDELREHINAVPADLPLRVALIVDAPSFDDGIRDHFTTVWKNLALRAFTFDDAAAVPGLTSLDSWLDTPAGTERDHATLLVAVQLHDLVVQSPPPGSAEAAIALLMVPQDIAERYRLTALAQVHRPRQGTVAALSVTLSLALKWGGVRPADVHHVWYAGFDKVGQEALLAAIRAEKIALVEGQQVSGELNVDRLVGDAGIAADWFALACALDFAQSFGAPQMVARHSGTTSALMIARPVLRTPVQTSL